MENIPIEFLADNKGYLDRECPNENCSYTFKINMTDWAEKISDDEVHCPMCGHTDTSDRWFTTNQIDAMHEILENWALSFFQQELNKSFSRLAHTTKNNKFVKITYKPSQKITFINNPIGQLEEWETDITCEKCGTRYSVIGSAYFCPCCGYNSAVASFNESLDSIEKMMDSIPEMRSMFTDSFGTDKADTLCRELVENSLGNIVSAFQKFACSLYEDLTNSKARVNDFQIVGKGSELFEKATRKSYKEWLSDSEFNEMNVLFQKRHLIEHNDGIVDTTYINRSGDDSYLEGQRVVIKKADAYLLLSIIKKLSNGLLSLKENY